MSAWVFLLALSSALSLRSAERPRFDKHQLVLHRVDRTRGDCVKESTCTLYTIHNVTVPTYQDVQGLEEKLSYTRETELPKKITAREGQIMQMSMRLALLSYGRNEGKGLVYHAFYDQHGDLATLELELKSLRHKKGEVDDSGHMVAYIVKNYNRNTGYQDGIGIVLSYKGSTNSADWKVNTDSKSVPLFPDLPEENKKNLVHQGFLGHKERLDERMKQAPMKPLKESLALWGVDTDAENFWNFLLEAKWKWCICVGHSLGGAMAAISALDLAIHTKDLRAKEQHVYAIGVASAIPGNKGFCESMEKYVQPHGGLRMENYGDVVTFLGYGKASFRRSKRTVFGFDWTLHARGFGEAFKKLKKHIQFDIDNGQGRITRYLFSAMGKTMISNPDQTGKLNMTTLAEED